MRIIARMDIKSENLIKSVNLEGLRVVGNPNQYALKYYNEGADEVLFLDCVASLYGRNSLHNIIKKASEKIFVPLTVGGGIRKVDDAAKLFDSGADKIAINSAAVKNPKIITDLANRYGSQAIVLSIEAKKQKENFWEVFIESGKQNTGINLVDWIKIGTDSGAGEVIITSIDREGTRKGFELDLYKNVKEIINVPLIFSGGFGKLDHIKKLIDIRYPDALAFADSIHYNRISLKEIRKYLLDLNFNIRRFDQ